MSEVLDLKSGGTFGTGNDKAIKDTIDAANNRKVFKASNYDNYECECGCKLFTTAVVVKKVPGVELGIIEQSEVPFPIEQIPIWVCSKCGELAPFVKDDKEAMEVITKLLNKES